MKKMNGQCHCGAVKFTVELTDGLNTARRCNCSYCRMRGAITVSAPLTGITVLEGKENSRSTVLIPARQHTISARCAAFILFTSGVPTRTNMA